jgi:hypothetical protein
MLFPVAMSGAASLWYSAMSTACCASTACSYEAHIRGYLVPYLGAIPLAALTAGDVQAMFTAVTRDEGRWGGR